MSGKSTWSLLTITCLLLATADAQQTSFSISDVPKMNVEQRRKLFQQTNTPALDDPNKFLDLFIVGLNDADKETQRLAAEKLALTMTALQQMKRGGEPVLVDLSQLAEVRQLLATKLNDPDRATRAAVMRALAYSDAPNGKTEAALLQRFNQEPDEQLKAGILQSMGFAGYDSPRFGQVLVQALNASHEVQIAAAEAVATVKPQGALPKLVAMLEAREGGGAPVIDAIASYGAEARLYLPQLEKLMADPSMPGDLRERLRKVVEAIKNPSPQAVAEPKVKAVDLVAGNQPSPAPPTTPVAATPSPATPVPSATPATSPQPATPVAQTPAAQVGKRAPVWPWLVGIVALVVIIAVALKRRG